MDNLYLRFYLLGSLSRFADALSNMSLPELVTCDMLPVALAEAPEVVPNDRDAVVLTEDIMVLAHFLSSSFSLVSLIFMGSEEELIDAFGSIPAGVSAIWPPDPTPEQLSLHAALVVKHLKACYDAWLYRALLTTLIDSVPDLVWFKDASGLHSLVNRSFCKAVNKKREEVIGADQSSVWNVPPERAHQQQEIDNAVMQGGKTVVADETVEVGGRPGQLVTYRSPVRGRDGQVVGIVGVARVASTPLR